MSHLYEKYKKEIIPLLQDQFNLKNVFSVPKVTKVVLHVGAGRSTQDAKVLDLVSKTLERISGQKPVYTRAKKSISNFKLRANMPIGAIVTLRGKRMYDFLDKFVNVTLPRVRDFRGLKLSGFDGKGNYTVGIKEHIVCPEIKPDAIDQLHGLEVTIITSAKDDHQGRVLLTAMGFPFQKKETKKVNEPDV